MVVPEAAGGRFVVSNGTVLCRVCDFTTDIATQTADAVQARRPVNFWVSQDLYARLHDGSLAFKSASGLMRYLMGKFVDDPSRFDDIAQYQDAGTDVKVNIWVEASVYGQFKTLVDERGLTVTDALKGLIGMFEATAF